MFLARLEGAPLSKAYSSVRRRGGATDNAVQKLYLEDYSTGFGLTKDLHVTRKIIHWQY